MILNPLVLLSVWGYYRETAVGKKASGLIPVSPSDAYCLRGQRAVGRGMVG